MKEKVSSKSNIRQVLGGTGQRVTPQRTLLLNMLRKSGGHLDADDLYRMARKKNPRISLSTVYRALRLFKKLGLVEELHFEDEHHHYENKPHREHFHIICLNCGQIVEFESSLVSQLKKEMGEKEKFKIKGAEVHLTGYCNQCSSKSVENKPEFTEGTEK